MKFPPQPTRINHPEGYQLISKESVT